MNKTVVKRIALPTLIVFLLIYLLKSFFMQPTIDVALDNIQNDYNNSVANPQYFHIGDTIYLSGDKALYQIRENRVKKIHNKRTIALCNQSYQVYSFLTKDASAYWERDLIVYQSGTNEPITTISDAKEPQLLEHYLFYMYESRDNPLYNYQVPSDQNTLYCYDLSSNQTRALLEGISSYFVFNSTILFTRNGRTEEQALQKNALYSYDLSSKKSAFLMDINTNGITNYFVLNDTVIFSQRNGVYQVKIGSNLVEKVYSDEFEGLANVYNNKLYILKTDWNSQMHSYLMVDLSSGKETLLFSIQTLGLPTLMVLNDDMIIVKTISKYFAIANGRTYRVI